MNEIIMAKKCDDSIVLEKLEEKYNVIIPAKDKLVMKSISRGVPKKKELGYTDRNLIVARFLSVSSKDRGNIWVMGNLINEEADAVCIPVAEDGFGGLYCMVFYSKNEYKIEYLPHDQDDDKRLVLCPTYKEFLGMLDLNLFD